MQLLPPSSNIPVPAKNLKLRPPLSRKAANMGRKAAEVGAAAGAGRGTQLNLQEQLAWAEKVRL